MRWTEVEWAEMRTRKFWIGALVFIGFCAFFAGLVAGVLTERAESPANRAGLVMPEPSK